MSGSTPESIPEELRDLEQSLRGLAPREAIVDRDTLLFRAGQASVPRTWMWPLATGVATTAALVLAVLLVRQPPPRVVQHIVYVPVEAPASSSNQDREIVHNSVPTHEIPDPSLTPRPSGGLPAHRRLEEHLLRWGFDALGPGSTSTSSESTRPQPIGKRNLPRLFSGELLP